MNAESCRCTNDMYRKAMKILRAKVGIQSNNPKLLPHLPLQPAYESLLTDFHRVEEIDWGEELDATVTMVDKEDSLKLDISPEKVTVIGKLEQLTSETSDLRYSIFGNEGLLFRYVLYILEKNYNIFSFHACGLYDKAKKHLFVIPGGAGSGKTCFILKGLELGLELFSAEMVHFRVEPRGVTFYKGALIDNIRIGNLKYSYPDIARKLNIKLPEAQDEWGRKIAVDLSVFQVEEDELSCPEVTVLFPHVEEERAKSQRVVEKSRRKILRLLFENASQKIGETFLIYERIPVTRLDDREAGERRLKNIHLFLERGKVKQAVSVVAGAQNCWEGII